MAPIYLKSEQYSGDGVIARGTVTYEMYEIGSSTWALRRVWTILQQIPYREGWHTIEWFGRFRANTFEGGKYKYPLIPAGTLGRTITQKDFEDFRV